MENFNERKKAYIEKARSNPEIIEMIASNNGNVTMSDEMLELVIDPKNEKELTLAENILTTASDLSTLVINIALENVKSIPIKENSGLKVYADLINVVKENGDINKLKPNMKENARLLYEILVGTISEPEESMQYIAELSGFDLDNAFDKAKFNLCINKINKEGNTNIKFPKDYTDEEINEFLEFSAEFHKLCKEGYLENKEDTEEITDILSSLFLRK